MKSHSIIFFIILAFGLLTVQPTIAAEGNLYEETITAITRIDGEFFRWTETREFLIINYNQITTNSSKEMEIQLQEKSQNGRIATITQPLKITNFELTTVENIDGTPKAYLWDIYLFRDVENPNLALSPLDSVIRTAYAESEQRVFDLDSTKLFFSVNLQHFEQDESGDVERYQVNTELSTKNYEDGRIEKAAVHIKKVDSDDNTVFEYSLEIQEKSIIQRYLNYLDQPSFFVPLIIGAVLLAVYLYIRIHKYWVENEIKIIRGKGKKITVELIDPPVESPETDDTSENTS
ncbi:MAG: hypothetical protein GPJ54_09935 [Candidatus Heimdallarchaeota archaeon]|nr:hypothetical protein [Candidatus Heimdallarchaeota archaeon]